MLSLDFINLRSLAFCKLTYVQSTMLCINPLSYEYVYKTLQAIYIKILKYKFFGREFSLLQLLFEIFIMRPIKIELFVQKTFFMYKHISIRIWKEQFLVHNTNNLFVKF